MEIAKIKFKVPSHLSKMDGVRSEDGGRYLTYVVSGHGENGLFFSVNSWDESKEHKVFKDVMGRKCLLTLEIIE